MAIKDNKNKEIIEPRNVWVGKADAPVSLVEYGDYQSESCAKVHRIVKKLMELYPQKLRYNFRHFPLTQVHQYAHKAAEASVAAAQEGKFWEMHDLIFNNQRRLGAVSLKEYAREAGVKDKNLLPKLVDSLYGWTVRADLLDGLDIGVRDVPTFFINDELFSGKPTLEGLSKAIDEASKHSRRRKVA